MRLRHARGDTELDHCLIFGIVNRTPDSFYDGGRMDLDAGVNHALRLEEEGADLLDLGAVKAGPGTPVALEEEWVRLEPLLSAIVESSRLPVSVETTHPEIARRAAASGAALINDVSALADISLAEVVAETEAGLVLMHNGGQIRGRPRHPRYADVVTEVADDLVRLAEAAQEAGVSKDAIMVDPGLDFGKTTFHSLELIRRLPELVERGYPVLIAASRKDVVGESLDLAPEDRLEGSLALASLAVAAGAAALRVHDVQETVRAVRMTEAIAGSRPPKAPVRGLWD
jgi:dihydropteroate synthase